MVREKTNHIEIGRTRGLTLKDTLHPWWVLTRYFSIMPDWCHPYHDRERPVLNAFRCIGIAVVMGFISLMMIFHLTKMVMAILVMTTLHSIIPYMLWLSAIPLALFTQLWYVYYRREFLDFFRDWGHFEKELMLGYNHHDMFSTMKKTRALIYTSRLLMLIGLLVGMGFVVFRKPDVPYLLSHLQFLRQIIPVPILCSIHLVNITCVVILASFCDSVSALAFFHIALEVRVLLNEFERIFTILDPLNHDENMTDQLELNRGYLFATHLRQLFDYYETLRSFVTRSNSLFGVLWFLNHCMRLSIICIMLYSVLYMFQSSPEDAGIYLANLLTNVYELVICTLLTTKIYCASDRLRSVLTVLLTKYWDLIPNGERELLIVFIGRLQTDPLAASPLGLYNVTPSFLLTITSLTITYVVILLQSK